MEGVLKLKDIKPEQLQPVYNDLCNIVGLNSMLLIYSSYKGQQISFPQKLFSKEYIAAQILSEYDGSNIKSLAKKYGFSERWIRKIINDSK